MSEEKKKADLILEQLATLSQEVKQNRVDLTQALKTLSEIKPPNIETHSHSSHEDHLNLDEQLTCPSCGPQIKSKVKPFIEKDVLGEYAKSIKGKKIVKCVGCGLPVSKEAEECPSCGSKEAE